MKKEYYQQRDIYLSYLSTSSNIYKSNTGETGLIDEIKRKIEDVYLEKYCTELYW